MQLFTAALILTQTLTACGSSSTDTSKLPPVDDSTGKQTAQATEPVKHGLSNGQKVAMLAGAAALYYMYKKNQESHAAGSTAEPQYYLSKNGRVYYREKGGRVHWVTPPANGIQVPADEAAQYSEYQGYNNQTTGRDLVGLSKSE